MFWLEVGVTADGEAAEAVADYLRPFAHGDGVVLEQLGDESNADPLALQPDIEVKIYIPGDEDSPALRRRIEEGLYHLGRLYPIPAPIFRQLRDEDWATVWREHYKPFRIGKRIWIRPSWAVEAQSRSTDLTIVLDPGMAFGTGTHPSTRLCLQALEAMPVAGRDVLDIGTGSGILAIGAAKLGANWVVALDVDGVAARTAVKNSDRNQSSARIDVFHGRLDAVRAGLWDIVMVNILAPVIIQMVEHYQLLGYVKGNGRLILGGIIDEQLSGVVNALERGGGYVETTLRQGDWVGLVVRRHQKRHDPDGP